MPVTTNFVSSNPAYGEVYSIQFYGIKFVGDLRQFGRWFPAGTPISSTNKTDGYDITETLWTVVLNTITPNPRILDIMKLEQIHFMVVKK